MAGEHELKITTTGRSRDACVEVDGVNIAGSLFRLSLDSDGRETRVSLDVMAGHPDRQTATVVISAEVLSMTTTVRLSDAALQILRAIGPAVPSSKEPTE